MTSCCGKKVNYNISVWLRKDNRTLSLFYRKTGATVYALLENNGIRNGYGEDLYNPVSWPRVIKEKRRRSSGGTLKQFVDLTGGSILVGEMGKADELLIKLTSLIRSSYTIGYYPENTNFDGHFRRINLELSPLGKTKERNNPSPDKIA